ncbi:Putative oxidoreductase [Gimesia panareensis]|uniref:Oxidoreductase n=1 Tax=Gimesia panareensis TaxID=2527978 RepID=A0A517Q3Y0_9PLAN|nr:FAD-dependent monooxygenase [Gimesia panareensis]QDT26324.1 Putative oxidoreductase [Gimesia panareensis]
MTPLKTISIAEASSRHWDVIVIGAGPAGAVAAYQLGRSGLQALLIERKIFPRYKVCGGCLNQRAVNTLTEVGLGGVLDDLKAVPLDQFQIRYQGRELQIPLPGGLAVSRSALDVELTRMALESGVSFLSETAALVCGDSHPGQTRMVELFQQGALCGTARASVILVADGLGHPSLQNCEEFESVVSQDSRIGVGVLLPGGQIQDYPAGTIHMAIHKHGYVGLARVEEGQLNIAAAMDRSFIKQQQSPTGAVVRILQESGFPIPPAIGEQNLKGTIPLTRKTVRPVAHRLILVGDAAGYLEPFTGEGMSNAISEGIAAASILPRGLHDWEQSLEQEWLQVHQTLTMQRLHWCRWLAQLLRSPTAIGVGLRLFRWFPGIARPIVASLNH